MKKRGSRVRVLFGGSSGGEDDIWEGSWSRRVWELGCVSENRFAGCWFGERKLRDSCGGMGERDIRCAGSWKLG